MNIFIRSILCACVLFSSTSMATHTKMVGGAAMYPTKNIVENAMNSKDHTTLVAAIKAAGLVDALEGKGPLTVFAPTNEAFNKLPAGTVAHLMKPENKNELKSILTYHVVSGNYPLKKLEKELEENNGKVELKTLNGEGVWLKKMGSDSIEIEDAKGRTAKITISDVFQSNGVIHVIDNVIMPN